MQTDGRANEQNQIQRTIPAARNASAGIQIVKIKESEGKSILAKISSWMTYTENVYQNSKPNYIICCLRTNHETDIDITESYSIKYITMVLHIYRISPTIQAKQTQKQTQSQQQRYQCYMWGFCS